MKRMFKNLRNSLFPKWRLMKAEQGTWNMIITDMLMGTYKETRLCLFLIKHSERLNEFKLFVKGYKADEHPKYPAMVEMVRDMNFALQKANREEMKVVKS